MEALAKKYSSLVGDKQIVEFIFFLEFYVIVLPNNSCDIPSPVEYGRSTNGAEAASLKTIIVSGDSIVYCKE